MAMALPPEAIAPTMAPSLVMTRQATRSQVKDKALMLNMKVEPEEEWEVKPEILVQLKKSKVQSKTTTLILESYTESSSKDLALDLSGKEVVTLAQDVDDSSNTEDVQPVSPPKRNK